MEQAINYIHDHFADQLSLSLVAEEVRLSESYLSRKLKKALGITFVEYVTKLRMDKAVEYLETGRYSVNDISYMLGYCEYRYFSGCFKKYTGYTPSKFHKRNIYDK